MAVNIRQVKDLESMLGYHAEKLNWQIDFDSFYDLDNITYGFDASDVGLKDEEFSKIASLRQLRPLIDNQTWGIFAIDFDSKRFEITALRKVLSGLVPNRRNSEHAMWDKKKLLFLCFWGDEANRTIGVAYFEDKEAGLPQIKIIYCNPKVEDFTQLSNFENKLSKLTWPANAADSEAWQNQWAGAFSIAYRQVIQDSQTLTTELAAIAKSIQGRILNILQVETANGYVHLLYDKFRQTLIHDMTEEQFADMYAQTVAYGLFSARCMDTDDHFDPEEAIEHIPNTNPFLKKLMKECFAQNNSKLSFDELELNEVVELLKNTDTDRILDDFNRQTGGGKEDPVIYFYEGFLNAYESEQKKRRGVYYTPQPVVNFIVRAVDDILKTEFGYENGLASTETKTIGIRRESKRRIDGMIKIVDDTEEVPAIQILDPATGTGTFLRQTILQIYENFKQQHKGKTVVEIKQLWNDYVPKHLLPRLNGFELMMAPYAVAHMKLAMVLKETGYDFSGDERVNVFLTNSLEEAGNSGMQIRLWEDPLASESVEANQAKKNKGINVVIGNPPYSGESANKGDWIMALMEDYKKEPGGVQRLHERNPKWINDDYVKFIRYAQSYVERAGAGIVAFINPHGFLGNPTFRGMRWNLLDTFDNIYVLDLHGNSNRKETCPDGSKDENVFDIQQGVCVCIFVKKSQNKKTLAQVFHTDIYGLRESKYNFLNNTDFQKSGLKNIILSAPEYFFKVVDADKKTTYDGGFKIDALFRAGSVGIVTARDGLTIDFTQSALSKKLHRFIELDMEAARKEFDLGKDVRDWKVVWAQDDLKRHLSPNGSLDMSRFVPLQYRVFDKRVTYYTGASRGIQCYPRDEVMKNFLIGKNIGLATARSNKSDQCDHFYLSSNIMEAKCAERTTQSAIFPLFLYEQTLEGIKCRPNLDPKIICGICTSVELSFVPKRNCEKKECFTPLDLLDYIYAVLHSPHYRETYKEFLKIDFPRVPYPTDKELFWKLVEFGGQLRQLHLLESSLLDNMITTYPVGGSNVVDKTTYREGDVIINKEGQGFHGVPQIAWEFYIGGYQPAQKWLKDRKGRALTDDDILHYQRMIVALIETDRIMKEIDEILEL